MLLLLNFHQFYYFLLCIIYLLTMFCLHMANKAFHQLTTSVTCRCSKNRHSELQMSLKDCLQNSVAQYVVT